jgi:hypothetical protein
MGDYPNVFGMMLILKNITEPVFFYPNHTNFGPIYGDFKNKREEQGRQIVFYQRT